MTLLFSLEDARDIVVVLYGILGILFFIVGLIVALLLFLSVRGLIGSVKDMIDDSVKPTLDSVRDTAKTIQGTTEFVGQSAVRPIMRTYGMVAGIRRGLGVLSGLTGRKRD